jgi:hypothetical protein
MTALGYQWGRNRIEGRQKYIAQIDSPALARSLAPASPEARIKNAVPAEEQSSCCGEDTILIRPAPPIKGCAMR